MPRLLAAAAGPALAAAGRSGACSPGTVRAADATAAGLPAVRGPAIAVAAYLTEDL